PAWARRTASAAARSGRRAAAPPACGFSALARTEAGVPRHRPAGRHAANLRSRSRWPGRPSPRTGPALGRHPGQLQTDRRAGGTGAIMTSTQTAVRHETTVAVPVEKAFAVFTEQFDRIQPRERNLPGVPILETVFERHVGGHVYDRGEDGSVCAWARVLAFEPPTRFVISWDSSPQWQVETDWSKCS